MGVGDSGGSTQKDPMPTLRLQDNPGMWRRDVESKSLEDGKQFECFVFFLKLVVLHIEFQSQNVMLALLVL